MLRENPDTVRRSQTSRGEDPALVDVLLAADTARRADPRNGIALNALYDRAFDRGLITFDESFRVVLSDRVRSDDPPRLHRQALIDLEKQNLRIPDRFAPDPLAMASHREHIFDCVVRS